MKSENSNGNMYKPIKTPEYKYKEYVTFKKICNDGDKRYFLLIKLLGGGNESVVVIMKNPSKATESISDYTVNNVIKYLYEKKKTESCLKNLGTIVILNIFPFYKTDSSKLNNCIKIRYKKNIEKNIEVIKELISKHNNIILGWGNPPKGLADYYKSLTTEVIELTDYGKKAYVVGGLTKKCYPRHGQVWNVNDKLLAFQDAINEKCKQKSRKTLING